MKTAVELALYAVVRGIVVGFCRLFWRLTVEGRDNVPDGPFILSAVHRSNIDSPLVAAVTSRRVRYMGKQEMWKLKPAGWFFSAMGGFPVARGTADRAALRQCVEVLKTGEPLVLFPEGTRRSGPDVEDLFDGAAYVAGKAQVPILPVGIGGSERAMPKGARMIRPVKVHLVIGEPIEPPKAGEDGSVSRRLTKEKTVELRDHLQRLFDQAERRVGHLQRPSGAT